MDPNNTVVFVFTSDGMGQTQDQALRVKLADTFLRLLDEAGTLPGAICFYTEGVRLACEDSPVLEPLRTLEEQGVPLVLCNTCLKQFGLEDKVEVGITGGMSDILTAMWQADSVISL